MTPFIKSPIDPQISNAWGKRKLLVPRTPCPSPGDSMRASTREESLYSYFLLVLLSLTVLLSHAAFFFPLDRDIVFSMCIRRIAAFEGDSFLTALAIREWSRDSILRSGFIITIVIFILIRTGPRMAGYTNHVTVSNVQ